MNLFPNRIGRLEFLLRYAVLVAAGAGNMLLAKVAEQSAGSALQLLLYFAAVLVGIAILIAGFRSLLLPRLRNLGLKSSYALLIFVPFVNLAFLLGIIFAPSDAFNKSP